jgi:hypothetical protein
LKNNSNKNFYSSFDSIICDEHEASSTSTTNNSLSLHTSFSIQNMFKFHKVFSNCEMKLNSNFLNIYMAKSRFEPNYQIICSLLNDKIYQLYNEYMEKSDIIYKKTIEQLKKMEQQGENYQKDQNFEFHNGTSDSVWQGKQLFYFIFF